MKQYDTYKDSGIEWIGKIPSHWEEVSIKWLSKIFAGGTPSKNKEEYWYNGSIPWLNSGTVNQGLITEPSEFITELGFEKSSAKWIPSGALVMALAGQGKTKGMVAQLGLDATCNQSMAAIIPVREIQSRYLLYWLQSNYQNIRNLGGGDLRDGLNLDMIGSIKSPIPNNQEQIAIASYLDCKTAEIDTLIADKKRLLELYEEEKTAIINQAVTKGINPKTKMKNSGIEWLGEIPEHWEVKKIKHLVSKVGSGVTPSGGASVYQLKGIPLLRSQNVHHDGLRMNDVAYITDEIHASMKNSQVCSGDVLLNITGASIGRTYFVESWLGEANVNQHVCILRPNPETDTKFLYFVLRSNIGQEQIRIEQTGSGREGLNFEALKSFNLPYFPIEEQQSIVQHIETECARTDAKIMKTLKLIDLLTEYRTALISEVVTGKIKVID